MKSKIELAEEYGFKYNEPGFGESNFLFSTENASFVIYDVDLTIDSDPKTENWYITKMLVDPNYPFSIYSNVTVNEGATLEFLLENYNSLPDTELGGLKIGSWSDLQVKEPELTDPKL